MTNPPQRDYIEIPLTRGKVAKISPEDFELVNQCKWYAHHFDKKGREPYWYARAFFKYQRLAMHRLIMDTPKGLLCDHINGDTLDNRRENLRNCTRAENNRNKTIRLRNNKSGFKGVHWSTKGKKWVAKIKFDGEIEHLGSFSDKLEAAAAYNAAAKRLHGEFASLNQII